LPVAATPHDAVAHLYSVVCSHSCSRAPATTISTQGRTP